MPQIVAVFLVAFWASMALLGFVAWYWAIFSWAVMCGGIEAWSRLKRIEPKKPVKHLIPPIREYKMNGVPRNPGGKIDLRSFLAINGVGFQWLSEGQGPTLTTTIFIYYPGNKNINDIHAYMFLCGLKRMMNGGSDLLLPIQRVLRLVRNLILPP